LTLGEPLKITQKIADSFHELLIPYMVAGSLASSLHGIPRATQDADIVADIKTHHVEAFIEALKNDFYVDEEMVRKAITQSSSFNVIHFETMFKVDIFILKKDETSKKEMSRRQGFPISGEPGKVLYLTSAEDIIVRKLFWFDLGNRVSERQWKDVISVLQVQGKRLDYDYLNQAAARMNVSNLLEKAVKEADKIASKETK
jgi:hypothetical protein